MYSLTIDVSIIIFEKYFTQHRATTVRLFSFLHVPRKSNNLKRFIFILKTVSMPTQENVVRRFFFMEKTYFKCVLTGYALNTACFFSGSTIFLFRFSNKIWKFVILFVAFVLTHNSAREFITLAVLYGIPDALWHPLHLCALKKQKYD